MVHGEDEDNGEGFVWRWSPGESVQVVPNTGSLSVAEQVLARAGNGAYCVAQRQGVKCFGNLATDNNFGASGRMLGGPTNTLTDPNVVCGEDHCCAWALGQTSLYCWGSNEAKQCNAGELVTTAPQPIDLGGMIEGVALGARHSCAQVRGMNDVRVHCWGDNTDGKIGINADDQLDYGLDLQRPVQSEDFVQGEQRLYSLVAGPNHTCAALGPNDDGDLTLRGVMCWGNNTYGGAGEAQYEHFLRATPTVFSDTEMAIDPRYRPAEQGPPLQLAANAQTTCFIVAADRSIACFGSNQGYVVDPAAPEERIYGVPGQVTLVSQVDIFGMSESMACAKSQTDDIICWGASLNTGDGLNTYPRNDP